MGKVLSCIAGFGLCFAGGWIMPTPVFLTLASIFLIGIGSNCIGYALGC